MKPLLLMLVVFCGCNANDWKGTKYGSNEKKQETDKIHFGVNVVVVNECQYVLYVDGTNGSATMVHAGNCNNPIHKKDTVCYPMKP